MIAILHGLFASTNNLIKKENLCIEMKLKSCMHYRYIKNLFIVGSITFLINL